MSIGTESIDPANRSLTLCFWTQRNHADYLGHLQKLWQLSRASRGDPAELSLEDQPNRSPATNARLGVCLFLLGRFSDAVETLAHSDGGALTHFYLGKAYLALDRYAEVLTAYESAERAGYSRDPGGARQGRSPPLQPPAAGFDRPVESPVRRS